MISSSHDHVGAGARIRLSPAITAAFVITAAFETRVGFGHGFERDGWPMPDAVVRNGIHRVSGPDMSEGVTGAEACGSYVRAAKQVSEEYGFDGLSESVAYVQVVNYPVGYRYAAHDTFGVLLVSAAHDEKVRGTGDMSAASKKLNCIEWEFADKTKGGVVCHVETPVNGTKGGLIRWVSGKTDACTTSVSIAYLGLDGLPGQLVDKYLHDYPSSVPKDPSWHLDWETKDLEKWADVLNSNKDDRLMLQVGAAYLVRYDKQSYGLLDALRKGDDATGFPKALDDVVGRIGQVVTERKAKAAPAAGGDE